jgi:hypothetical protein
LVATHVDGDWILKTEGEFLNKSEIIQLAEGVEVFSPSFGRGLTSE